MPSVTLLKEEDCCAAAAAILSTRLETVSVVFTTFISDWAVSSAIRLPLSTALTAPSINSEVLLEASADLLARLRTSSATTANPLPAVPARAASTAALRARMLVWKAMSSMVLMILPISADFLPMSSMASIISCIC